MTRQRRLAALGIAGFGTLLSLLCGWLLAGSIMATFTAWSQGAAEVRISGGDVAMLALMPIYVALAVWGTLGAFGDDDAVERIGEWIAVAGIIALAFALGGSWVFQGWAERRLSAQGYVRCGTERLGKFQALTMCARKPGRPKQVLGNSGQTSIALPTTVGETGFSTDLSHVLIV